MLGYNASVNMRIGKTALAAGRTIAFIQHYFLVRHEHDGSSRA